jgi:hypothetical protein
MRRKRTSSAEPATAEAEDSEMARAKKICNIDFFSTSETQFREYTSAFNKRSSSFAARTVSETTTAEDCEHIIFCKAIATHAQASFFTAAPRRRTFQLSRIFS